MTEKERSTLTECFLFSGIELPEQIADLEPINFKKGDTVCDETHKSRAMGVVLTGRLVAFPVSGSKAVLSQFSAGDSFGVASMFGGECYVSRIIASKDSKILFLSEDILKQLFKASSDLAINYISFLSSRIRLLNQKISLFASSDSTSKVYSYILSHTGEDGKFEDAGNMSLLAKKLGIGRTTLYREINKLCEQRLIRKENSIYYVI